MRIVSDFDGVLTDPTREGQRVGELFFDRLAQLAGARRAEMLEVLGRYQRQVAASPSQYGWRQAGRLSAFADEDVFITNIALADCLDLHAADDPFLASLRPALTDAGLSSFGAASGWAYRQMTDETRQGAHAPIDRQAAEALAALLAAGHEVVVVSNSESDRVLAILREAGLSAVGHDEDPRAPLRVRGGAKKYELGGTPRHLEVGAQRCEVDRPRYEAILREERPAAVIGDVFSLDLALPIYLARHEAGLFPGLRGVLRLRSYTPAWVRSLSGAALSTRELVTYTAPSELPSLFGR